MKIVYLYTETAPYVIAVIKHLVSNYNAHIIVFNTNSSKSESPYIPSQINNVSFYNQNDYSKKEILDMIQNFKPDLIYTAGWINPKYVSICKKIKKTSEIPIIAGCDTQWSGSLKHQINSLLSPFRHKKWFTHIMVCGSYQYEYARKLGFSKNNILFNNYSADIELFNLGYSNNISSKKENYPHTFVYVGRFVDVKGIDILIKAFKMFKTETINDWKLVCIGNGTLKAIIENTEDVLVYSFMEQNKMMEKLKDFGCFVLPSIFEPWGVVIHEFACAGLPLILSDKCGANSEFLINGYNGYSFRSGDVKDLCDKMKKVSETESLLIEFGQNSHVLGQRITPAITAATIVGIKLHPRNITV